MSYLLDTTVVVALLRDKPANVRERYRQARAVGEMAGNVSALVASLVRQAELLSGLVECGLSGLVDYIHATLPGAGGDPTSSSGPMRIHQADGTAAAAVMRIPG